MKTFKVYASQLVFYEKEIQADSIDDANEIAWQSHDKDWKECQYGDWAIETDHTIEVTE